MCDPAIAEQIARLSTSTHTTEAVAIELLVMDALAGLGMIGLHDLDARIRAHGMTTDDD